jgi:hypothetical protein
MYRKQLIPVLAILLAIALVGCGIGALFPSKDVPPLGGYSTVVLLPFDFEKPSKDYAELPIRVSYAIGTKLKVRRKETNWIYDQSQEVRPVSEKLEELGMSGKEVFEDPLTASKVAEAFQADLVIAGRLDEPDFTMEESGKIYEDKSQASSMKGGVRFYATHQTAILPTYLKLVEPKTNQVIWDGKVVGYKKYDTRYRTGAPKKVVRDETMMADVRRDLVANVADKLYPAKAE